MLKIKNNVDLKELEKFGFEYDAEEFEYIQKTAYPHICIFDDEHWANIHRQICNVWNGADVDILFDLIQAGLVEKVKEDE